jgi:predicted O-methyltransferase YrrM
MSGSDAAFTPPVEEVDPLTRLAIRHGSDKWGAHFYTPVYHRLFAHLRDKSVRLLEIGVGGYQFAKVGGASLAMWADYFPHGRILGIDVFAKNLSLGPRVAVQQGAQDDVAFLARMSAEHGPFDIVIDDGSHDPAQVTASFEVLFPLLVDGGLYVIEDVQSTFQPEFGGSADGGGTMRLAHAILKHLHHAEIQVVAPDRPVADIAKSIRSFRAWHNLFVVEKGDNTEPSNSGLRLDDFHVARALRTIKGELVRAPTPAVYANLIDIQLCARNLREAWILVEEALARWPKDPTVLHAAYHAAIKTGDRTLEVQFLRRLVALEPDNGEVQALLGKAEAGRNRSPG